MTNRYDDLYSPYRRRSPLGQEGYRPRFKDPTDDDDPYSEEEAFYRKAIDELDRSTTEKNADYWKARVGFVEKIRNAKLGRENRRFDIEARQRKREQEERARAPRFQEEQRPTSAGTLSRYRLKIDPDTGAVLDESYVGSVDDVARQDASQRAAQAQGNADRRFTFEQKQAAEGKTERDRRFSFEQEQARKAQESENYRLREYYDRLAQGENYRTNERRQMEANRQEQVGFAQQARQQREQGILRNVANLEQLMREPARFWASIGNNPQAIEGIVAQLLEFNTDGRFNRIIDFLKAGPQVQQRQLSFAREGGRA